MVYNHVFARWDPLGERFWDEEQQAYVQTTGVSVDVQHATKRLRYENGGTQVWIQRNGAWEEYDPDSEYIIDMQEDWETGALLVYNNDFERYEPYGEPFQPDGADYTLINEFDMVYLMYDDGTTICLENFGDGAMLSTEATGYGFMEMRGEKSYYDSSNGFWWSYGWDGWSFSIDGGSTWKETPSLEIQVVEDSSLDDYMGAFDGQEWSQVEGRLEFLDQDYAMAGWLGMDQFFYDLYDGVGYDGEPLRLTYQEVYDDGGDEQSDRWDHLPSSGHETNDTSVASGNLIEVRLKVYGVWSDCLKASFNIPNPTAGWTPDGVDQPLSVMFVSKESPSTRPRVQEWFPNNLGSDVLFHRYDPDDYSLSSLVDDLQEITYCLDQPAKNLVIHDHASLGVFGVGVDEIIARDCENALAPYRGLFRELNDVMVDASTGNQGGQIQYYGCETAGVHSAFVDPPKDLHDVLGAESMKARRMLATIAQLSNTTVFASSDSTTIGDPPWWPQANITEFCLEFGVGPDGNQVSYKTLDTRAWDITFDDGYGVKLHVDPQGQDYDLQKKIESHPAFSSLLVCTTGEVPTGGPGWHYEPYKPTLW